jgi:hypothetical protein
MNRFLETGCASAIAVLACWFTAGDVVASHPDILRDYRFIPSRSTLDVSGGFIGIQETFRVYGTFGIITGYDEGDPAQPTHRPYAQFFDVRAWLVPGSPLAHVWDVDETLNLTGLDGTFQDPSELIFSGADNQGQPFHLQATIRDRLIHLVGESEPGCCDLFQYNLNALAYLRPNADFNLDGAVDSADYLVWRRLQGQLGAGSDADGNGDGVVDTGDYELWRAHFGETFDTRHF